MPDEPIIEPARRPDDPTVPGAVALVPAPFAYHRAARHLKGIAEGVRDRRVEFFHLCWPADAVEPWALAGPALGAPAAVLALEKLVVLGAERILVVGPCGSLAEEAPIGTVVVATEAVSEEGTSRLYGAEAVGETDRGAIAPGRRADLVVLEAGSLEKPSQGGVAATVRGGRVVWKA